MSKSNPSAKELGYQQPAEWAPHDSVWLAFPSHAELWQEDLRDAQNEFIGFAEAICNLDANGVAKGEKLNVLVPSTAAFQQAEKELAHLPVTFHHIPFGDIWLRDTAPIFLKKGKSIAAATFRFNSWGSKYNLPYDDQVAARVAAVTGLRNFTSSLVLEGGSIEVDGEGTCLSSRQCLLNPNRNPRLDQEQIEKALCEDLGVEKVIWVGDGLLNDHTDGHIDTIARLVAPGKVLCMTTTDRNDPNKDVLEKIAADLRGLTDAKGRRMEVGEIPSPGRVTNDEGEVMPASYLNFYIANTTVVVPTYGMPADADAVAAIGEYFPGRKTVGRAAKAILTGGGAFHCISQQQPSGD